MKKIILSIWVCLHVLTSYAQQNHVSNGSFESRINCPTALSQVTQNCAIWYQYTPSSDYFNSCATTNACDVPVNYWGYQPAAHGNAYVGGANVYGYPNSPYLSERNAASIIPLTTGLLYEVSMSVSLGNICKIADNALGALFFKNGDTAFTGSAVNITRLPQVSYASYGQIKDTQNWVRVTGTFIADSAYDHIVIGGFYNANTYVRDTLNYGNAPYAYYYIDSVVVKLADSFGFSFDGDEFCAGDTIDIDYFVTKKKNTNNVFSVQLSDAAGSFASPVTLGTNTSDTSGTISAVIPSNTTTGAGYKLRMVASSFADTTLESTVIKIGGGIATLTANNNSPVCANDTLELFASTTTTGVTFSWTGPNSFASNLQNPTIPNPIPANDGDYIVTAKIYGCIATDTTTAAVENGTGSTGLFASSNSPVCAENTLQLSGSAQGSSLTYTWTGPNGFTSSTQNPNIDNATTNNSGSYILYVSNGNCTVRDTVHVTVKPIPQNVQVTANLPICTRETFQLNVSTTTTGVTYSWDGPNSFSSTSATPFIFNVSSVHDGDYIGTIDLNGCTVSDTVTLAVKPLPNKPVATNNSPFCAGAILNLTGASTTTGVTYSWTGPNSYTSTTQNPVINNATTAHNGDYIFSATLNDCSTKDTTTVAIKPNPNSVTLSSNSAICAGSTLQLNSTASSSGVTYAWTGPNSYTASTQNSSITNAMANRTGWYKMVVDLNGCIYEDSLYATVHPIPNSPTLSYNNPICLGETLSLTASTVAGATYSWTGANGFSATTQNTTRSSMQFSDTGIYKATVSVNGCVSPADSVRVHLNANPFVVILSNPTDSICQGDPVLFTALANNHGGTPTYQWYVNSQPMGSGATYNTTGLNDKDIIKCVMVENTKCSVPYTDESNDIYMTVLPWLPPSVTITADKSQPLEKDEYITFTAHPVDAGASPEYQWKRNGNNISGATGGTWSANTLSDNDSISVEVISKYKCPQPPTASSNGIVVRVLAGVDDLGQKHKLSLYPNPNRGTFTVKGSLTKAANIDVVNAMGQVVYSTTTQANTNGINHEISLPEVASGIYLLRLHTDAGVSVLRFVVE